ncbi:MAG: hypothetical protein ACFB6R_05985 [Alphaproteobacteria bacterium]
MLRFSLSLTLIVLFAGLAPDTARAQDRAPLDITPRRFSAQETPSADAGPTRETRIIERFGRIEVTRITGPRYRGPGRNGQSRDRTIGLGPDPWKGTPAPLARALIEALPVGAPSPTMGALIHALLTAPGPGDEARTKPWMPLSSRFQPLRSGTDEALSEDDVAFLILRLSRLHEAGHMEDAASLAAQVTEAGRSDRAGSRIQAMAALLDNEHQEACDLGLRMRLETEDPFWVKLRAFCYLLDNAASAALLTADVLVERGTPAPVFHALTMALTGRATLPESIWTRAPLTPLAYAMARHGGIPLPDAALDMAEPAVLRAIAMDIVPAEPDPADPGATTVAPAPERSAYRQALTAAERSVLSGALDPAALAHAYRQVPFDRAAMADPLAAAQNQAPAEANALFFQVIEKEAIPASRIELLAAALDRAWATESGLPVALVYGDTLEGITPDPDLGWAAADLALAALLNDQPAAAYAWRNVLSQTLSRAPGGTGAETLHRLDAALAVAAPRSGVEAARARVGFGPPVLPGSMSAIDGWIERASGPSDDAAGGDSSAFDPRLVLTELEILGALGHPLTDTAWIWLTERREQRTVAVHASPALTLRALDAAAKGRIGEAVALALIIAGKPGPADGSLATTLTAVRILNALGLDYPARRLALEALLSRARPAADRALGENATLMPPPPGPTETP